MKLADLQNEDQHQAVSEFGGRFTWQAVDHRKRQLHSVETCAIFAGQGANRPGMFEEYWQQVPGFRRTIEQADKTLAAMGLGSISRYILQSEELSPQDQAVYGNICLFVSQVAIWSAIQRRLQPKLVTSHSFGEFAALVAAGVVRYQDMLRFVVARETKSPAPNSVGYMIAIAASAAQISEAKFATPFTMANFNSPEQTVLSAQPQHTEKLVEEIKAKGFKCKQLATPQPYHSPLLDPLRSELVEFLSNEDWQITQPQLTMISSVLGRELTADDCQPDRIKQLLTDQLVQPVKFVDQIALAHSKFKRRHYLEIGPRSVLTPMIPQILAGRPVRAETSAGQLIKKSKTKPAKKLKPTGFSQSAIDAANKVIASITGYKIESINLEDRFQDDLGIDSIKKAEIVFTVLGRLNQPVGDNFDIAAIENVHDLIKFVSENYGQPGSSDGDQQVAPAQFHRCTLRWLPHPVNPLATSNFNGSVLTQPIDAALLDASQWPSIATQLIQQLNSGDITSGDKRAIALAAKDWPKTTELDLEQWLGQLSAIHKLVGEHSGTTLPSSLKLILVGPLAAGASFAAWAAFARSLAKESRGLEIKTLQTDAPWDSSIWRDQINLEARDGISLGSRWIGSDRYMAQLQPTTVGVDDDATILPEQANVVALGGAKGITFALTRALFAATGARLHLIGRSPAHDPDVVSALKQLQSANAQVSYHQVDASDSIQLNQTFQKIVDEQGPIDLVINGAGVERSRAFTAKESSDLDFELRNKLGPALHAQQAAARVKARHVVHFTSIVGWYGNRGQTVYSFANALIDGLAQASQAAEDSPVTTAIGWPPWDNLGMTANRLIRKSLEALGVGLLSAEDGARLFLHEVALLSIGATNGTPVPYVHEPRDDAQYGGTLRDLSGFRPIIGEPRLSRRGVHFEVTLAPDTQPYLTDHKPGNAIYVPAATGLAMMFANSLAQDQAWPTIKQFAIKNPAIVPNDGLILRTSLSQQQGERLATVRSQATNYTGLIESSQALHEWPQRSAVATDTQVEAPHIYAHDRLFHGPSLQIISSLSYGTSKQGIAKLAALSAAEIGHGPWGAIVLLIDGALQAHGCLALEHHQAMFLPVGIEYVAIEPKLLDSCEHIELNWYGNEQDSNWQGDALGLTKENAPVFFLRGISMKKVEPTNHQGGDT